MSKDIGKLYNDLSKFNHKDPSDSDSKSIHKLFKKGFPLANGREIYDVNEWLLDYANLNPQDTFLDAGCGNGNSTFLMQKKYQSSGVGISVSEREIDIAKKLSVKYDCANAVTFKLADFETSHDQKFGLIYGIESFKHAPDLSNSIKNLADLLLPDGLFIIIDDYLNSDSDKSNKKSLEFKKLWQVAELQTEIDMVSTGQKHGLTHVETIDFTNYVKKPSVFVLKLKIASFKIIRLLIGYGWLKRILNVFIGGFIQDMYYSKGLVSYKAIILSK